MRSPFQYLSLLTATLLLSLTSPLQLPGTPLGIPGAMAAKSAKDSKVEAEKLPVKSFQRFNGGLFQIAGSLGTGFKIKLSPSPQYRVGLSKSGSLLPGVRVIP